MRWYFSAAMALLLLLCAAGCASPSAGDMTDGKGGIQASDPSSQTILIGAKPFNEQYILSEMIALLLEEEGYNTEVRSGMNDATLYEGIKKGQIDVYVEYTGTAYSQLLKLPALEKWNPDVVYADVEEGLGGENVVVLCKIGFRDDYAIAVKEDWAEKNGVQTITQLTPFAPDMVLGSDLVFNEREDGLPRLEEVYGIEFKDVTPMSPTLMYEAIDKGQVDAIPPYTTDTRVDLYNLRILSDDKAAMPPYETMILLRGGLADDSVLTKALGVLENRIDTDTMRTLNARFDIDKDEAREIARDYLVSEGLIKV